MIVAVQSVFLFFHFLFKSKGVKVLNRLVALICLCFTLIVINTYLSLGNYNLKTTLIQDIANNVMWFLGPSLYLYTIYHQKRYDNRMILLNTTPFLIPFFIDIFIEWPWFSSIIPFVAFTQMSIYLFLALKHCIHHYRMMPQFYNWILPAIVAIALIVVVNFSLYALRSFRIELLSTAALQSFTSLLAIPVFYLAYKEMNATNDFGIAPKKYSTTPISEEKSNLFLKKIMFAMESDKLYLDKNLSLQSFSDSIGISSKYVSQVINKNLGLSFSDYLLQFRLKEVKKNLIDSEKKHLTILGIAQESGFSSSSRFNHLFKKNTGLTPRQFQQQHRYP